MYQPIQPIEPVDYVVIGHITQDKIHSGLLPGGTAAYSALTAKAVGLRVGMLTSYAEDAVLPNLEGIQVINQPAEQSTVFENIYLPDQRKQILHSLAANLHTRLIPETWTSTQIVHLGPVAQEVDPAVLRVFQNSFIGITPQGWFREWDKNGNVHFTEWLEANHVLRQADAAVLSIEDVQSNEDLIADLVYSIRVLVVTEGAKGSRVYWHGDVRYFQPPEIKEGDATGAGDIYATAFFIRYQQTKNPWEAARFATLVATNSITRPGLAGVPTADEIQDYLIEIIN